jgi:hypothetical protein
MRARARAFAEPLMAGEATSTGENVLAHADATADILAGIGGSEAMQAAVYLVYACAQLNRPEEVIGKAFGESFARWPSRPPSWSACSSARARPRRAQLVGRFPRPVSRPSSCARCCWPSRATCAW